MVNRVHTAWYAGYVLYNTKTRTEMGKGKPRTATNRRVNSLLIQFGTVCEWWDGGYPECSLPWNRKCNGNPFNCKKLYFRYLASSKKVDTGVIADFEGREKHSQKPKY